MKLDSYHKKRNFKITPEPKGKVTHKYKQLFIIQKHAARHLHYDFRLELNGILLSWAVPKGPCLDPTVKRLAIHVEDHPVEYGHFEGVIPKGEYGGGTVMLWDKGKWFPLDENPTAAYHKGHLKFILKAKKLNGEWNLIKLKRDDDNSWFLIKGKDDYTRPLDEYDITLEEPNSVISHNSIKEIEQNYKSIWTRNTELKKASEKKSTLIKKTSIKIDFPVSIFPKVISPQLATLVDEAPTGNEWAHEIKFDGYRILAFKEKGKVRLMSRNNNDWTDKFSNIAHKIEEVSLKNIILDGEVVILDKDQKSNFQMLQKAIGTDKPFVYYIFDLLYYDKYNLMKQPLIERKKILKQILDNSTNNILRYSNHIIGRGHDVFKNVCDMGLEGIVSKNLQSSYAEKRTKNWLKVKCVKGLRTDKPEKKITREKEADIDQLSESQNQKLDKKVELPFKLTHPDKILYPESKITKLDLAKYFDEIQEWILPYVVNRPLTLVRCPENYHECFYQKHTNKSTPKTLYGIKIREKDKTENCIYIKDREGLMAIVQMSTLEIHPWGSRIENIEHPDTITIDLDPAPDIEWKKVVLTAKRIQKHLLDFNLKSFVKTTGGKGLHVVIPIQPEFTWAEVKNFTHVFVNFLVTTYPNEYVSEMSKAKRKGKIFIDYLRNQTWSNDYFCLFNSSET